MFDLIYKGEQKVKATFTANYPSTWGDRYKFVLRLFYERDFLGALKYTVYVYLIDPETSEPRSHVKYSLSSGNLSEIKQHLGRVYHIHNIRNWKKLKT